MFGLEIILGGAVAAILAAVAAYFGGRVEGRRKAERKQEAKRDAEYRKTRERVDEAVRRSDGDTRPVDERLRERGRIRD